LVLPALSQSFLTSSELEKENAHFDVVEALIQAMEESRNVDLVPRRKRTAPSVPPQSPSARGTGSLRRGHTRSRSDPIRWPTLRESDEGGAGSDCGGGGSGDGGSGSDVAAKDAQRRRGVSLAEQHPFRSPLKYEQLPGERPPPIDEGAGGASLETPTNAQSGRLLFEDDADATFVLVDSDNSSDGSSDELDLRLLVAQQSRLRKEIAQQFPGGLLVGEGCEGGSGGGGGGGGSGGTGRSISSLSHGGDASSSQNHPRSFHAASENSSTSASAIEFWRSSSDVIQRTSSVDANHFLGPTDARSTAQGFLKSVMPSISLDGGGSGGGSGGGGERSGAGTSPGRGSGGGGEWLPDLRPLIADEVVLPGGSLPEPIINISDIRDGGADQDSALTAENEASFVGSNPSMLRGNDDWAPPRRTLCVGGEGGRHGGHMLGVHMCCR
jgi:hypothetical protein